MNLPRDFTGWTVNLTHDPNSVMRVRLSGGGDFVDISESVHHVTLVDHETKTVDVSVRQFTDGTAEHIQEILRASWTTAPRGILDQVLDQLSRVDVSKVKETLELVEYIIRLLIQYGGPVLDVIQVLL